MKDERCIPCELSTAGGMMITDYATTANLDSLLEQFGDGAMTLRELHASLGSPEGVLEGLQQMDVPLDLTVNTALKAHNKTRHK